ncbi:MAG: carboxypeptidase regulatory-like domain-containing protein [Planctomycetaceae bacterium]|nr:carboxypeptidase regulatory-like domain-containing protein [Planctomycetaceae bacterium]
MTRIPIAAIHLVALLTFACTANAADGVIEGTAFYQPDSQKPWRYARYYVADAKKGHLAEAVVCLTDRQLRGLRPPMESRTVTVGQEDYRFIPETVALRIGDQVKFTNSDATLHNVMALGGNESFNVSLAQDGEFTQTFRRAGNLKQPVKIGCSFHSQMQAWIFVFDHPFYAVTAENGRYRFEGVPPGEYTLELFHPAGGMRVSRAVTVTAGQTNSIDLRTSPADIIK